MKLFPQYAFKKWHKRLAVFLLDAAGILFSGRFFRSPAPFPNPSSVHKILLIRLDHLGDVVMTRPAMAALKRKFPQARIEVLIGQDNLALIKQDPWVDEFIPMKHHWFSRSASTKEIAAERRRILKILKDRRYDVGIDFRGDFRHIVLMRQAKIKWTLGYGITGGGFLLSCQIPYDWHLHQTALNGNLIKGFGVPQDLANLRIGYPAQRTRDLFQQFPALASSRQKVLVHPGAGYASKKWPVNHYRRLIDTLLTKANTQVVLIGTEEEKKEFSYPQPPENLLDLRGTTRLEDLPALMDLCQFYIGNDSGPAHIAAAQGLRGIILFSGTNDSRLWRPWSETLKIISKEVPCSPCGEKICPLKYHDCMEKISVEEVLHAYCP